MENNTNDNKAGMKMNTCGAVGCGCGHHHMHIMKWLLKIAVVIIIFCFAFQMGELKGMLRSESSMRAGYGRGGDMMMYRGGMMNGSTVSPAVPMNPTTGAATTQ